MKKELSLQMQHASTDGVTRDTPLTETRTLHSRSVEEQRGIGLP